MITFLLAGLSLLATPFAAIADGLPSDQPLTVLQPANALLSPDKGSVRQAEAVHSVQIGAQTLALKVRYGRPDRIDATGVEASTGIVFRRSRQLLTVDRPQSGERVEVSLLTGRLWVDGKPGAPLDLAGIETDGRLWLSPEALSSLVGVPVSVSGRPEPPRRDPGARTAIATTDLLFPAPLTLDDRSQASLLLAAHSPEKSEGYSAHRFSIPDLVSFEGALGGSVRQLSSSGIVGDWRARESWQIETETRNTPEAGLILASVTSRSSDDGKNAHPRSPAKSAKMSSEHANEFGRTHSRIVEVSFSRSFSETPANNRVPVPSLKALNFRKTDRGISERKAVPEISATEVSRSVLSVGSDEKNAKATYEQPGPAIGGTVFLDLDGNGRVDPIDQRLEGELLALINIETGQMIERRSAAFGQFGFADLKPGRYRLRVLVGWQEHVAELTIRPGDIASDVPLAIATGPPASPGRYIRTAPA
ncbi:carboxypeptidase-like regulatory domain-containing protein [Henriciella mobilis]|uniref:carboxypeptidase-like regulatory domain-containing protein n=1 Tax=Henriciella mobilis TaxID=2305467 RepID=UPI0011C42B8B|nr:carboxypeptidase-like regulatory domain-containing protein [Henriciella mobilis]